MDRQAELNDLYGSTDVIQHGAVMKGYVPLSDKVTADEATLDKLFGESLEFAKTLKPKPSKKKSK